MEFHTSLILLSTWTKSKDLFVICWIPSYLSFVSSAHTSDDSYHRYDPTSFLGQIPTVFYITALHCVVVSWNCTTLHGIYSVLKLHCTVLYTKQIWTCTSWYCALQYSVLELHCTALYSVVKSWAVCQSPTHGWATGRISIEFVVLHYIIVHCTALQCTTLHCTARHCTVLHITQLGCTVVYCTVDLVIEYRPNACLNILSWYSQVWISTFLPNNRLLC